MLADISGVDAVYIVCGRTDMRKSIDGLCAIIKEEFSMDMDHALFLFCGRRCDRIGAPGTDYVIHVAVPQWRGWGASGHHLPVFPQRDTPFYVFILS